MADAQSAIEPECVDSQRRHVEDSDGMVCPAVTPTHNIWYMVCTNSQHIHAIEEGDNDTNEHGHGISATLRTVTATPSVLTAIHLYSEVYNKKNSDAIRSHCDQHIHTHIPYIYMKTAMPSVLTAINLVKGKGAVEGP